MAQKKQIQHDWWKDLPDYEFCQECNEPHYKWFHEALAVNLSYVVKQHDMFIGGFGGCTGKGNEPFFAKIRKLDNGFATCDCTDGKQRVIPTFALTYQVRTRTMCGF